MNGTMSNTLKHDLDLSSAKIEMKLERSRLLMEIARSPLQITVIVAYVAMVSMLITISTVAISAATGSNTSGSDIFTVVAAPGIFHLLALVSWFFLRGHTPKIFKHHRVFSETQNSTNK